MVNNIYLLLGLSPDAPWAEVSQAYNRLMDSLEQDISGSQTGAWQRLQAAKKRLNQSYDCLQQASLQNQENQPVTTCRPRLGQMLIAAGLLTLEELDTALEIQRHIHNGQVPLGELLVAAHYITQQQLDYYLRQQELFELPPDHPQRWGQRLVELGLVTADQLRVALIEQKNTCQSLRQALINRGWLSAEELDRIF